MNPVDVFTFWDYTALTLVLCISAFIGIYHGVSGGKQTTTQEYFLGNRQMSALPVALSVLASYMSAITYLGTPAESYIHGPQYWMVSLNVIVVGFIITRAFVPIFYRLKLTSIYEYFDLRYNKVVRLCVVAYSTIFGLLYMGMVIYAPSLALNAVTGINLAMSILTMGIVCTIYTSVGGIKAVIWTDVFQSTMMMLGFFVLIVVGCANVGGPAEVWRIAEEGNRTTIFDFRLDPTIRHSFWTLFVGGSFQVVFNTGANQLIVQRYLSCSSEKTAITAAWLGLIFIGFTQIIAVVTGIIMYAYYAGCDPLLSERVLRNDQLIPLFIVDLVGSVPGLSGVLVSSAFSASLSTISSGMNTLAAIAAEDLIKPHYKDISDYKLTIITKIFAAFCGVFGIILALIASVLGDLLSLTLTLMGIVSGPVLGVFTLAIFFPWSTARGSIVGLIIGSIMGIWFAIGIHLNPTPLDDPPLTVDECTVVNVTDTSILTTPPLKGYSTHEFPLERSIYSVSYMYISFMTWAATCIFGLITSFISGANEREEVDPKLLCNVWDSFLCCFPSDIPEKAKAKVFRKRGVSGSDLITSPRKKKNTEKVKDIDSKEGHNEINMTEVFASNEAVEAV